ncbi:hypothetical protein LINPERHAP1_LOCUS36611 [Linum perenne]
MISSLNLQISVDDPKGLKVLKLDEHLDDTMTRTRRRFL